MLFVKERKGLVDWQGYQKRRSVSLVVKIAVTLMFSSHYLLGLSEALNYKDLYQLLIRNYTPYSGPTEIISKSTIFGDADKL